MQTLRRLTSRLSEWPSMMLPPNSSALMSSQRPSLLTSSKSPSLLFLTSSRSLSTSSALCRRYMPFVNWGPYLSMFSPKLGDGERKGMMCAFKRFKRLDWGMYVRPRGGRKRSWWMKSAQQLYEVEQHILCAPFHVRRLERMFHPSWKEKRHFPDDIYEPYHKCSWLKHYYTRHKNRGLVKMLGNNVYRFNRWTAHLKKKRDKFNRPENLIYDPPGFLETVLDNEGAFRPEFVPEDTPAPHFQRPLVGYYSFMKDKRINKVKDLETYGGKLDPWHPLYKSEFKWY